MSDEYRILSIDGGGIKGLYAAKVLSFIEEKYHIRICDYFDLIAGTSTGAIVAAALALGIKAEKICGMYLDNAKEIFSKNIFRSIFVAKYDNRNLKKALDAVFGNSLIDNCKTRLIIPTFNITTLRNEVYKTSHAKGLRRDRDKKLVDILMATSAAPLYFKPYEWGNSKYIDGGLWANNPSHIAILEGITRCNWELGKIKLLSISCTENTSSLPKYNNFNFWNIKSLKKLIEVVFQSGSQYVEHTSEFLLKDRYVRINTVLADKLVSLDKTSPNSMRILCANAETEAAYNHEMINEQFLKNKIQEFIPYKD